MRGNKRTTPIALTAIGWRGAGPLAMSEAAATRLAKHSLVIAGHRTSISLEDAFWQSLRAIAAARGVSLAGLVVEIDAGRGDANLSSAIRVFVLRAAQDAQKSSPTRTGAAHAFTCSNLA